MELAKEIDEHYNGEDEIVIVGVLKGAFVFMSDLVKRLKQPHRIDFLSVSSYGDGAKSTGCVRFLMDMRQNITGKHVLVVEDIIDSGYTLEFLVNVLKTRRPKSLKTIAFLSKPANRKVTLEVDWIGFAVENLWVVV